MRPTTRCINSLAYEIALVFAPQRAVIARGSCLPSASAVKHVQQVNAETVTDRQRSKVKGRMSKRGIINCLLCDLPHFWKIIQNRSLFPIRPCFIIIIIIIYRRRSRSYMDIDRCYERSFRFLFSMRLSVIYKLYFFYLPRIRYIHSWYA